MNILFSGLMADMPIIMYEKNGLYYLWSLDFSPIFDFNDIENEMAKYEDEATVYEGTFDQITEQYKMLLKLFA